MHTNQRSNPPTQLMRFLLALVCAVGTISWVGCQSVPGLLEEAQNAEKVDDRLEAYDELALALRELSAARPAW